MTDVDDVRALLAKYWQHLDDRLEAEWVDLFADDAVVEYEGTVARSRSELAVIAADLKNHQGGKHLSSNEVVNVDGENASARSDVAFLSPGPDGNPVVRFYGRCEDTFRKDGQWRFTSRRITFQGGRHGG
jgi:hypothetical protein